MKFLALLERVKGRGVVVLPPPPSVAPGEGNDPEITGVCEDSRKVQPGDLFVARSGTKVDGIQYIPDALARGAVAVLYQNPNPDSSSPGIPIPGPAPSVAVACVQNANLAAALLAHELAGHPTASMKMIAITGTKGKTTVAYLLRSVLKAAGHKVGMIGTVEIDDGAHVTPAEMTTPGAVELVALFSRMQAHGVTHCVMEVSSHALHQHRVAGIDWAVAIFTNLTGDHLDYHHTMEEYAAAKAMLFEGLKPDAVAVVNADDSWVGRMVQGCRGRVIEYRHGGNAAWDRVLFGIHKMSSKGMLMWVWPMVRPSQTPQHSIRTSLVGRHNAYNIASVYTAVEGLGIDVTKIDEGLEVCSGAPGRLQRVGGESLDFQVFVDYAHTHDALENVLTALRTTMEHASVRPPKGGVTNGQLICLFGCGGDRDRIKRPLMAAVAERLADVVIVTSDNPRTESASAIITEICTGFSPGWKTAGKITVEPDRHAAIKLAINMAQPGDVVLLAGKGHENYQIIGTTKHHFDDVEEAEAALRDKLRRPDGTENIFQFNDPDSGLCVIVEDDGRVAYAYMLKDGHPVADVWLYNRQSPPGIPEWKSGTNRPPFLNPLEFAEPADFSIPLSKDRCRVMWLHGGGGLIQADIFIDDKFLARVDLTSKPGWSRLAKKDGPLCKRIVTDPSKHSQIG